MNDLAIIKKLHEKFPEFDVETILGIMECIQPECTTATFPNTLGIAYRELDANK